MSARVRACLSGRMLSSQFKSHLGRIITRLTGTVLAICISLFQEEMSPQVLESALTRSSLCIPPPTPSPSWAIGIKGTGTPRSAGEGSEVSTVKTFLIYLK